LANFHAGNSPALDPNGPSDAEFAGLSSQERYNWAMDYYLGKQCSTGRMAELLQISWLDMRERFNRLGVPLFLGAATTEEARAEFNTLLKYLPK
jgi:hypothetical protein